MPDNTDYLAAAKQHYATALEHYTAFNYNRKPIEVLHAQVTLAMAAAQIAQAEHLRNIDKTGILTYSASTI